MKTTEIPLFVPLGTEAHRIARQFAVEQSTPQKGKRVYLNTLAVYAIHTYLKWLGIETDLNLSQSWEPTLTDAFDATDLFITPIEKLECRPVLPEQT